MMVGYHFSFFSSGRRWSSIEIVLPHCFVLVFLFFYKVLFYCALCSSRGEKKQNGKERKKEEKERKEEEKNIFFVGSHF